MNEIQRYRRHTVRESEPMVQTSQGIWCNFSESEAQHLADKTAALEAQAEGHKRDMRSLETRMNWDRAAAVGLLNSKHLAALEAQAEGHTASIVHQERAHHDSMTELRRERAELLAKAEAKLALNTRLHKEEIAFLEAQRGEGEPIDLMCEVLGRLVIEIGQHINPQIVVDLDLTKIQQRAERCSVRALAGDPHA